MLSACHAPVTVEDSDVSAVRGIINVSFWQLMVNCYSMITLKPEILSEICDHAKSEFPNECCGIILGTETQVFVRKCRNIQNELHQEDPDTYPRDARTAYVIHPDDLIAIHKESDTQQRQIKAFYHSHPNHEAYFSEKDKADATVWGEPAYPGATYLVISIYDTEIRAVKAFTWDETAKDFIEIKAPFGET